MANNRDRLEYENEGQNEQAVAETPRARVDEIFRGMNCFSVNAQREVKKMFDELFEAQLEQRNEIKQMKEQMDKAEEMSKRMEKQAEEMSKRMEKLEEEMRKQKNEMDHLKQSFSTKMNSLKALIKDVGENVRELDKMLKQQMTKTLKQQMTKMDQTLEKHLKELESGDKRSDGPSSKRRKSMRQTIH